MSNPKRRRRRKPLGEREMAAILAGLRLFQALLTTPISEADDFDLQQAHDVATQGDTLKSLESGEINRLCRRLERQGVIA